MILLYLAFGFIAIQYVFCDQLRCDLFELNANVSTFDKIEVIGGKTHFYINDGLSEHHWTAKGSEIDTYEHSKEMSNTKTLNLEECNSKQYQLSDGPNGTVLNDTNGIQTLNISSVVGVFCQNNNIYVLVQNKPLIYRLDVPNSSNATIGTIKENKSLKGFFTCNESPVTEANGNNWKYLLIIIFFIIILIVIFVPIICYFMNKRQTDRKSESSKSKESADGSREKDLLKPKKHQKSGELKPNQKSDQKSTESVSKSKESVSYETPVVTSADSSMALINAKSQKSPIVWSKSSQDSKSSVKSFFA